jgi:hypothetical protein
LGASVYGAGAGGGKGATTGPTSSPSAWCCTRCWRDTGHSAGTKAGLIAAGASDPDFGAIRSVANPQFVNVLRGCLEKEPAKRWQSILDVKRLLEWPDGMPVVRAKRAWLPWVLVPAAAASAWMIGGLCTANGGACDWAEIPD